MFKFSGYALYPPWFVMLWAIFALAAVEFMADLLVKPRWAMLFGAVGGPVSYLSGAALSDGALQPAAGLWPWLLLALLWAVIAIGLGQSRGWYERNS